MHPTIRIIYLLALAAAVYITPTTGLAALLALSVGLMLYWHVDNFLKLFRKMRWLMLFLLVIYAFNTPGEYLQGWPFDLAPTYEGLYAGMLQGARIVIMLAGVSILLKTTSRDNLMAGFFLLLYPLKWVGLHPERLAARIWLTLHYVETAPPARSIADFLESLDEVANNSTSAAPSEIRFDLPALSRRDMLALLLLVMLAVLLS